MENLEAARIKLGLSRRQICKLLKVDPSAWTRWMKSAKGAPPHVHQSIEWYMRLVEQNPAENAPYVLTQQIENSSKQSEIQISRMKKELETLRREHIEKKEVFEQLGSKIQNSFENILLKFRDQMIPLKMAEVDTLKYDNKRLHSTIGELESKLEKVAAALDKFTVSKLKPKSKSKGKSKPKAKIKSKPKKARRIVKKKAKKAAPKKSAALKKKTAPRKITKRISAPKHRPSKKTKRSGKKK